MVAALEILAKRLIDKAVALAGWGMGERTPAGILTSETRRA